ncbi:peptidylprolyl isomerase [Thiomicrospira sp. R3]|uniref:peptidylprolyl isomerase n=1 Tax=Thiomicrospira sp. R3 TaxID=3035472 RepID=UPI00259B9971|nr:peptidylprolyl isomerase [Thiomicrospira sp. R3]WFE68425.1 peptidylprolyl isomerase [Thiomicrospira sp. R3]
MKTTPSRLVLSLTLFIGLFFSSFILKADNPQVLIETNKGSMIIELYPNEAPLSVENFLNYVNSGYYDGTIFHRVIGNFMIQGGGFEADFKRKPTHAPIQNEADNGLQNRIGTIAMARTNDPHSATSQFFINVANNNSLDFREKTPRAWGYAVFGRVTDGMRTVNTIRTVPTTSQNGHQDVPVEPVIIERARQIK